MLKMNVDIRRSLSLCVVLLLVSVCIFQVVPNAYAAEESEAITIPPFSYEGMPFDSLPTTRTSFWIIKHANGSYSYVSAGSAFKNTSVNLTTRSISSSLYSCSVNGNNWKTSVFNNGSWSDLYSDSSTYYWFLLYEGDEIVYCSIPVYDPDGNLIWPRPEVSFIETILSVTNSVTGSYVDSLGSLLEWISNSPLLMFILIGIPVAGFICYALSDKIRM